MRHRSWARATAAARSSYARCSSGAQYVAAATVWSLTREREIAVSVERRVAYDAGTPRDHLHRCAGTAVSDSGWTLPGVMTVGAAQGLLKAAGMVAAGRVVFAGCGPLLWLTAWQYLNAGVKIDAILDTTPRANRGAALPHAPAVRAIALFPGRPRTDPRREAPCACRDRGHLAERSREARVNEVAYASGAAEARMPTDVLLLHQGVAPNVNLAMSVGIEHRWSDRQLCWVPVLDRDGNAAIEGIAIAGDGAGIAGADAAEPAACSRRRRRSPRSAHASRTMRRVRRGLHWPEPARQSLPRCALSSRKVFRVPSGDTIVCRCEEVSARQIPRPSASVVPGRTR